MKPDQKPFTDRQVAQLSQAFHRGAAESSVALARWLSAPATIAVDSVDQCPLEEATAILGDGADTVCMCVMQMEGTLSGRMLLAFDDADGLAATDLLMGRALGSATNWGEMEISSVQETMNIVGSAYLNGIARDLSQRSGQRIELLPTPPVFLRDFVESLLETAFLDQAMAGSHVVFARTRFDLSGKSLEWTFLLIPDPSCVSRLQEILSALK